MELGGDWSRPGRNFIGMKIPNENGREEGIFEGILAQIEHGNLKGKKAEKEISEQENPRVAETKKIHGKN